MRGKKGNKPCPKQFPPPSGHDFLAKKKCHGFRLRGDWISYPALRSIQIANLAKLKPHNMQFRETDLL